MECETCKQKREAPQTLLHSSEPLPYDGTPESRQKLLGVVEYCMHKLQYKPVLKELLQTVAPKNENSSFIQPLHIRLAAAYNIQKEKADKLEKKKHKYEHAKEVGAVKKLKKELKQVRASAADEKYRLLQQVEELHQLLYGPRPHQVSDDHLLPHV